MEDLADGFHDGVDETLNLLCKALGLDSSKVDHEAATETVDGDISVVIHRILDTRFGEGWRQ